MEQQVLLVKQPAWRPPVGAPRSRLGRTLRWSLLLVLLIYLFSQFFHSHTANFVHRYTFGSSDAAAASSSGSAAPAKAGAGSGHAKKPLPAVDVKLVDDLGASEDSIDTSADSEDDEQQQSAHGGGA